MMEFVDNQVKVLLLVLVLCLSLTISGVASAAVVNGTNSSKAVSSIANASNINSTNSSTDVSSMANASNINRTNSSFDISSSSTNNATKLKSNNSNVAVNNTKNVVTAKNVTASTNTTNLPADYDLRDYDKVGPVGDQGTAGTCWAFAALNSLESCLLPAQSWDFSVNNMKDICSNSYPEEFDRGYDDGGTWQEALAYLSSYQGPVTATQDPYNTLSGISPSGLQPVLHVQDAVFIPPRTSTNGVYNNTALKLAIMKYGAIYSLMDFDDSYYNSDTDAYYYNGSYDVNHAVDIVGWDDNYSKTNFAIEPPGNGAFIVENSWGTDWGDGGFFYVSYYDTQLANDDNNVVFMDAEPVTNYNDIYQYDPLGAVGYYGLGTDTAWFSNVFKAKNNEQLAATSFYVLSPDSPYNIYVYLNPKANDPASGTLALVQSGLISNEGYFTINLSKYVKLISGETFSIVVKLTTPNFDTPITLEYPVYGYSSQATASPGQSYVSSNGTSWVDMTTIITNANVCLKAFAVVSSDLAVSKKVIKTNVGNIYYMVNVLNHGPDSGLNVIVDEKIPNGIKYLSYYANYGVYNPVTGIWTIGTLPNGAVALLIINGLLYDSGINGYPGIGGTVQNLHANHMLVTGLFTANSKNHQNMNESKMKTVPTKKTGIPLIPLIIGIFLLFCGLVGFKRLN